DASEIRLITALITDAPAKAIADDLGVSESTLSRRASVAFRKLGVRSRGELVLVAGALEALGVAPARDAFTFVWVLQHLLAARGLTPTEAALVPLLVTGC